MKLKVLSSYHNDTKTRFGDCLMLHDNSQLVVFDCGHIEHAKYVESFLENNLGIKDIYVVVSHNDSDHTDGVLPFLEWLSGTKYNITVVTPLYLKSLDDIHDKLDDSKRKRSKTAEHILEQFDRIAEIVETAKEYGYCIRDAMIGTRFSSFKIVGPRKEEFVEIVAKAIEEDGTGTIGGETVMNAASVQIEAELDDNGKILLCGDASPEYMHNLNKYDYIQFPHHGQAKDGKIIIEEMLIDPSSKIFVISDNTGSGNNSGGSDELMKVLDEEMIKYFNTKDGVIDLPTTVMHGVTSTKERRVRLGGICG